MSDRAMNRPKRAPCTLRQKIEIVRWKAHGKTVEEIGVLMGICQRKVRKRLDYMKEKLGVTCDAALIHVAHALGLIWACEEEAQDWVKSHVKGLREWREAA